MMNSKWAISPPSWILVTGANGYIGSHIVDQLLTLGLRVRGTVRNDKPWLDHFFQSKYGPGKFESVVVPRLDDDDVLLRILDGISGVIHVASDLSFRPDAHEVIPPMVTAMRMLLRASSRTSVERFVLTSSSSAALLPNPGVEGIKVTEETWNYGAVNAAWEIHTPVENKHWMVYAASKTEVERAAWKWMKEYSPSFVLNSVLPDTNIGPILHQNIGGSTMKITANLLEGNESAIKNVPPQWFVDVQDNAKMHVIALLSPELESERLFAFSSPFNWTQVTNILRNLRPHAPVPRVPEGEQEDLMDIIPAKRAEELLMSFYGHGWTNLETSLKRGIESLNK
ncbi:hypothetical protein N7478_006918 [Penicillium angulare]|uniref:uncharacterized protein n=1 Tax=Penicillium angulare TaxID=116970 RepID=UPI00253F89FC|nr:uncharacterized protein N7478_006918 [Penicillium angulare]KAJ5281546.1 hypothetical protein N7478_006918 [Penicillium angulare]